MVTLGGDGVSSNQGRHNGTDLTPISSLHPADRYLKLRELERDSSSILPGRAPLASAEAQPRPRLAIVGDGRLGRRLAAAFRAAGYPVHGPLGRGADGDGADVVLLCVPDSEIGAAARSVLKGPVVGHCSGATGLGPLAPHEALSLHPLMTVTSAGADFTGAGAAIAGSTPRAQALAAELAEALGMRAVVVGDEDRPAYHAAASIASNFLVTLEAAAEQLAETAGIDRALLVPLVRATVENWAAFGPQEALTGPVARGDEETVEAQRAAVSERAPELLGLFDALVEATREIAGRPQVQPA